MSEVIKPLPYEGLSEQLTQEAVERLAETYGHDGRTVQFQRLLQEIIHDTLEIGMELGQQSPGDAMEIFNAGYAMAKAEEADE